jgi:phosphatidate cytidylyltransferase
VTTSGELPRRIGVAVLGIPAVFGALYYGGWVLGALIALAAAIGAQEFFRLVRAGGGRPYSELGIVAAAGLVLLATAWPEPEVFAPRALYVLLAVTLLSLGVGVWRRWPDGAPLDDAASTVLGVVYTGGALSFVPLLRALPDTIGVTTDPLRSATFALLPLLVVWASDSAAYFVGRAIGRTKLAPRASPGKTVEGSVAGLVGAMVAAWLVARWSMSDPNAVMLDVPVVLAFGLVVAAVGQVGDLAESVLKRQAGVKDSGHILPGHGGALDRLDALLFAFPVAWVLLQLPGVLP